MADPNVSTYFFWWNWTYVFVSFCGGKRILSNEYTFSNPGVFFLNYSGHSTSTSYHHGNIWSVHCRCLRRRQNQVFSCIVHSFDLRSRGLFCCRIYHGKCCCESTGWLDQWPGSAHSNVFWAPAWTNRRGQGRGLRNSHRCPLQWSEPHHLK